MTDHEARPTRNLPRSNGAASLAELADARIWSMLELAPDGLLLTDGEGIILLANRQVEALFGYDRSELIGEPIEILVPEPLREVHLLHRKRYRTEPTVREMGAGLELAGRRRDGTEFPVEISLSPIADVDGETVVASIRDVSDRVEARRRLQSSERAFRAVFESAPAGLVTARVHPDGRRVVERVNPAFCEMVAAHAHHLEGSDLAELVHPDDAAADRAGIAALTSGGSAFSVEQRFRRTDGSYVWVLVHASVVDDADGRRLLAHVVDLTDRRAAQAERARADLLEDRERIGRDLHDLVIQRLFAAGMGLQSVLATTTPPEAVERIQATIDELDATIRELRSTIFGLNAPKRARSIDFQLRHAIDEQRAAIGFDPTLAVVGDPESITLAVLEQLLPTLREALSNVARHARASSVHVAVVSASTHTTLEVIDDGVGIDPTSVAGNGLGNMERRARRLGGSCTVVPAHGGGTHLTWTAPR